MKQNSKKVSYLAEFTDKRLEKEHVEQEIGFSLKHIQKMVLGLGILYFLFIIPDYFLVKNASSFRVILLNRIVFLILICFFYIRLKLDKKYLYIYTWITVSEIIASISFFLVFFQYDSPDFLIQAFGLMVIILGVFLVPNRWINMILVSVVISICFFVLSLLFLHSIDISQYWAAVLYTVLVIILSSISSFRAHYYKRTQYINGKELLKLSTTDPLTKIHNRLKFDEELSKWIQYSNRYEADLSLMIFDIDNFKNVNDQYGHLIGDQALIELSEFVKSLIRNTDIFARWGGEEFVILITNTNKKSAMYITERIRIEISNYTFSSIGQLTCSFGVAFFHLGEDKDNFIQRADKLLLEAKNVGKNTVRSEEF